MWSALFLWLSVVGMVVGLAGELVWVVALEKMVLAGGMVVMGAALVAGAAGLFTRGEVARPAPTSA